MTPELKAKAYAHLLASFPKVLHTHVSEDAKFRVVAYVETSIDENGQFQKNIRIKLEWIAADAMGAETWDEIPEAHRLEFLAIALCEMAGCPSNFDLINLEASE